MSDVRDLSVIPKNTDYCYEITSIDYNSGRIKTKLCPYWTEDKCLLVGYSDIILLPDQIKICGIGESDE